MLHVNLEIGVTVPHQFDESEGDGPAGVPSKYGGEDGTGNGPAALEPSAQTVNG